MLLVQRGAAALQSLCVCLASCAVFASLQALHALCLFSWWVSAQGYFFECNGVLQLDACALQAVLW
jgi:hypothetical protein